MSFHISLTTFQQIKSFVDLASRQPFDIRVGNERQHINGKDLMGMFSLDLTAPVQVRADCTEEQCSGFKMAAAKFLV